MEKTIDNHSIKMQLAAQFMAAHITGKVHAGFSYDSAAVATRSIQDAQAFMDAFIQHREAKSESKFLNYSEF